MPAPSGETAARATDGAVLRADGQSGGEGGEAHGCFSDARSIASAYS